MKTIKVIESIIGKLQNGSIIAWICKTCATYMICKTPELSDEKVKMITRMMSQ